MKTKHFLLIMVASVTIIVSCKKEIGIESQNEKIESNESKGIVKIRTINSRTVNCGPCCNTYWNCMDNAGSNQQAWIICRADYKTCMKESVADSGWIYSLLFYSFPTAVDFNNQNDFELRMYNNKHEVWCNEIEATERVEIYASGITSNGEQGTMYQIGEATYNPFTEIYEFSISGDTLEYYFNGFYGINFYGILINCNIPILDDTEGCQMADLLPLGID